jgi:ABC-type enterochelin transport system permease subunit
VRFCCNCLPEKLIVVLNLIALSISLIVMQRINIQSMIKPQLTRGSIYAKLSLMLSYPAVTLVSMVSTLKR